MRPCLRRPSGAIDLLLLLNLFPTSLLYKTPGTPPLQSEVFPVNPSPGYDISPLSPLESALAKNTHVNLVESALPKHST